jgi:hypothetical protein
MKTLSKSRYEVKISYNDKPFLLRGFSIFEVNSTDQLMNEIMDDVRSLTFNSSLDIKVKYLGEIRK